METKGESWLGTDSVQAQSNKTIIECIVTCCSVSVFGVRERNRLDDTFSM